MYKIVTMCLAGVAILFIAIIVGDLVKSSIPSIVVNGFTFFKTTAWVPGSGALIHKQGYSILAGSKYGILVFLVGTLASSFLAILFGVPLAVGIALFISQYCPARFSGSISLVIELMAGIPSVIYGFWGFLILLPLLKSSVLPVVKDALGFIPFFSGTIYYGGFLASGIVLAMMIIPIIAAISRDAMAQTPVELKEAGKALGMTDWEISRKIVLPYAKSGITGASFLGLGRALGETMAVALVCGAASYLPLTFYYPINTISAFIVLNLDSAFLDPSGMTLAAFAELALILLMITMIVNIIARFLVGRGFLSSPENVVPV